MDQETTATEKRVHCPQSLRGGGSPCLCRATGDISRWLRRQEEPRARGVRVVSAGREPVQDWRACIISAASGLGGVVHGVWSPALGRVGQGDGALGCGSLTHGGGRQV